MLSLLSDFFDRLWTCTTDETVREEMVAFFSARGHPCLVYGYALTQHGRAYPLPENFYSGVVKEGLGNFEATAANHPIIQRVGNVTQPFYWGHASSRGKSKDTRQSASAILVDCAWARDVGQGSCLVIPLHHPKSPPGLLSVFSELTPQ